MSANSPSRAKAGRSSGQVFPLRSPTGVALVSATVLASMVGFVDAYMINVAIPAIGADLHATVQGLQWVLTGYLVTVASLLLLAGSLADQFGLRRILIVGLGVMLLASVCCAAAPTIGTLVAARAIQGAGGALVVPSSLGLLNSTLRGTDRARGIGIWAGISTLGTTVGPYGGGWLIDHASWRYVFLLNLPLILGSYLALRVVPEVGITRRPFSLDVGGGVLAVLGLGGVIYALTELPSAGWRSAPVLVSGVIGLVCLAALGPFELRQRAPMLRTAIFRSRQFDAINSATLLFYGALAAASYLVVLQCQLQLGYSATQSGAALIPESVVFLLISPFVGGLVARFGTRWLMAAGILIVAVGFGVLSTAHRGAPYAQTVLPGALLWGLGIGLTVAPLTAGVLAAVDDSDVGEASAINDAASRVGGVVLIALVPLMLGAGAASSLGQPLADHYQTAMLILAGLSVLSAVITIAFVSHGPGPAEPSRLPAHPRVLVCAVPHNTRAGSASAPMEPGSSA